ncbi:hypothetical protein [Chamaesiphon sp. VAR_48_metabat_135_sub]|uniref:hypothetical protein n=1 Tax=Chamaesiphon sp. VAR_48_metabat_135_sub TaxID=2964699 RepID=UPI00286C7733|nr:hypothetical protein [Chamaesiphon sp. VAR_48_metabat_135_sub]
MTEIFTATEIDELSAEIDRQLQELRQQGVAAYRSGDELDPGGALTKQKESIESLTKEPMLSFLAKFGRAAKADICDKDGLLNQQWHKWGDLNNKDALERLGAVLVTMGFSGNVVSPLAVAAIVVIAHIGLKAFCEDYGNNT